jgi:hypothetical protein
LKVGRNGRKLVEMLTMEGAGAREGQGVFEVVEEPHALAYAKARGQP